MHRILRILFLTLITFSWLFATDNDSLKLDIETRNYDQQHIRLNLRFDFERQEVSGIAHLQLQPLEDDFREIRLHTSSTKFTSIKLNGEPHSFILDNNLLRIPLKKRYGKNDRLVIEMKYISHPAHGLFFFHPTEEIPEIPYQIWSQGEGENNRHWIPCYDKPDDKLTWELIATVPETLRVISNGELVEIRKDSRQQEKTFFWKMDKPQSSYLIAIAVGRFHTASDTVRGIPLIYNIPPDVAHLDPDITFGNTPRMMTFFSDYILPYPYKKYDQIPVQDFLYGGMENTTATIMNRRVFYGKSAIPNFSADGLLAHELAHQWFGDLLTCKTWEHIWLNEGFATYFTDLFFEHYAGLDEFRKRRLEQNRRYIASMRNRSFDKINPPEDGMTPVELSGGKAYSRGAAILHMLRFELGDGVFHRGIQKYVKKYSFKNVVSEDFRQVMEEVSGKDLSQFFKQWVYGAGFPELDVSYKWDTDLRQVILSVMQIQLESAVMDSFVFRVPVEISAGQQVIRDTILIDKRNEVFTFHTIQKPQMVRFDKGNWILKKLNFVKSFEELRYQLLYDDDVTGRIVAAEELAGFKEQALPVLKRSLVREPFYAVRTRIVKSLETIGGDSALQTIKKGAEDKDARVRTAAMEALAAFPADNVSGILMQHLESDGNDYVRGEAAASLGKVGAENAFKILKNLLSLDSHRNVIRRGVFDGMAALQDARALPLVKEYTQYKYSHGGMHLLDIAALNCAKAIAQDHREEAIDAIAAALSNPYFRTRSRAARLLVELDAKEKLSDLKEILAEEHRTVVKRALKKSIEKLSEKSTKTD